MKNKRKMSFMLFILIFTFLLFYLIGTKIKNLNADLELINQDNLLNDTSWNLKRIIIKNDDGSTIEESGDYNISILFFDNDVNICFSIDDCSVANYTREDNVYIIDNIDGSFLYGNAFILEYGDLLIERRLDDGTKIGYYFYKSL